MAIIFAAYTADLTGYLFIYIADTNIKTLSDLAAQSKIKVIVNKGTNAYALFKVTINHYYNYIYIYMYFLFCVIATCYNLKRASFMKQTKYLSW